MSGGHIADSPNVAKFLPRAKILSTLPAPANPAFTDDCRQNVTMAAT
jgi:hypothetical protein